MIRTRQSAKHIGRRLSLGYLDIYRGDVVDKIQYRVDIAEYDVETASAMNASKD